jgi:CheY-like chemotaxis protein
VLLDVAMPGMDGSQTLERIRHIRADVPVVVCELPASLRDVSPDN